MGKYGKLTFYYGTMSSGKSLWLLTTAHNLQENGQEFVLIKSNIDDRDGVGKIHSRALAEDKDCVAISQEENLYDWAVYYSAYLGYMNQRLPRWILVDEAQFLTASQVEQLAAIVDNFDVNVCCYGLRTDFKSNLFEGSKRLFELADTLEEIKSSCTCGNKTIFNARVNTKRQVVTDGEQVEIGGNDKYVSMCRKCYFEKTHHPLYERGRETPLL